MAGGGRRNSSWVLLGGIATPDHMQIGPYQDEVVAVNFARGSIGKLEHRHWRAARAQRGREPTWIGFGAAQFEHRVAVWNAVLDRRAVVEPDMRQPRAGPSRRLIFPKEVFGPPGTLQMIGEST